MKNGKFYPGTYMFTIDNCSSDPNELDLTWSEIPAEVKIYKNTYIIHIFILYLCIWYMFFIDRLFSLLFF